MSAGSAFAQPLASGSGQLKNHWDQLVSSLKCQVQLTTAVFLAELGAGCLRRAAVLCTVY